MNNWQIYELDGEWLPLASGKSYGEAADPFPCGLMLPIAARILFNPFSQKRTQK